MKKAMNIKFGENMELLKQETMLKAWNPMI